VSDSDELKQMTERAMAAEARVAELLEEQSRVGEAKTPEGGKDRDDSSGSLPPPPPPPAAGPGTYKLEQQLRSREEELARLADEIKEKDEKIAALSQEKEPEADGVIESLKAEIENLARKQAESDDVIERLTQENLQLLEHMAKLKRESDELALKAVASRDEISIVSRSRQDGTQPETAASPAQEPPEEDLPEVEPLPAPAAYPAPEPEPVFPIKKRSRLPWVFLFLVLAGAAFLAARHFYPELLGPLGAGTQPDDAVAPDMDRPAPPPSPAAPEAAPPEAAAFEEPAAEPPRAEPEAESPPAEPAAEPEAEPPPKEPPEEAGEMADKKESRAEKRRKRKTARARGRKTTVGKAKRQIRRALLGKQLDRAQELLDEWMEIRPQDAGLHYLYGRLFLMRGMMQEAVMQFKEAIEIAPKMSSAYHDLGAAYLKLGDNQSACQALGKFISMRPDHRRAPDIRELMKNIKCP
jgi:tetratricopeptide (TPR) repeat protein